MEKFKVGDIVKGNHLSSEAYAVTTDKMTRGRVDRLYSSDGIHVVILEHENPNYVGEGYGVNSKYFDLVETKVSVPVEKSIFKKEVEVEKVNKESVVLSYDDINEITFIVVSEKYTIAIPMSEEDFSRIGVSKKHDADNFNEEIGKALALYRSLNK